MGNLDDAGLKSDNGTSSLHSRYFSSLSSFFAETSSSPSSETTGEADPLRMRVEGDHLKIGDVSFPLLEPLREELVPNPGFFAEIPFHRKVMHDMLVDLSAGERNLLLIGNQVRLLEDERSI